jgi:hypothetical protein
MTNDAGRLEPHSSLLRVEGEVENAYLEPLESALKITRQIFNQLHDRFHARLNIMCFLQQSPQLTF